MRCSPVLPSVVTAIVLGLAAAPRAEAQSAADSAAIRRAALDYIEGWYAGDAERMERSLHGDLAKRIVERGQNGRSVIGQMTAAQLVQATGRGGGSSTPAARQRKDVRILDIFGNTASVRLDADSWIDYMHVARVDGEWKILNVLWELRPRQE